VGVPELRKRLLNLVFAGFAERPAEAPLVTRERHALCLETAASELSGFLGGLGKGLPMELLATHLRAAIIALEDLIGIVTNDDVLDTIFRQFCIGK
jgi:tRNA modification GTPase